MSAMRILKLSKFPIVMRNINLNYPNRKKYLWTLFRTILSLNQSIKLILDHCKKLIKRNYQWRKKFTTFLILQNINRRTKSKNSVKKFLHLPRKVTKAHQDLTHQMIFKDSKILKCNVGTKLSDWSTVNLVNKKEKVNNFKDLSNKSWISL